MRRVGFVEVAREISCVALLVVTFFDLKVRVYVNIFKSVYRYKCICIHILKYIQTRMCVYIYMYIFIYISFMYTFIQIYVF